MKKIRTLVCVCVILVFAFLSLGVAAPSSGPYINRVDIYRHCLETDDMLVIVRYNIPYNTNPADSAAVNYLVRLVDGTTVLGNGLIYPYYDLGYGQGLVTIYMDASEAPAWGGSYAVELMGNPSLTWTPALPFVSTTSLSWRATDSSGATSTILYSHLISYLEELSDYWGVALTSTTVSGTVLSTYGTAYLMNSIDGLRTMCPLLFVGSVDIPTYSDQTWQMSQLEEIEASWPLDLSGLSGWFGMSETSDSAFRGVIAFFIIAGIAALIMGVTNRGDFTLLASYGLLFFFGVTGWLSPLIIVGGTFFLVLVAGLIFLLGKA